MEEREFKTRRNADGEDIKFLDGYSYLGKEYILEELDVPKSKRVMTLLLDLDIENLNTLSDILKINPGKILTSLIKNDTISTMLAIILLEKKNDVTVECDKEHFDKGLMRNFKPFALKVFWDFFTLNSGLYEGIANFAKEAGAYWAALRNQVAPARMELMNAISLPKEKQKPSRKSTK